MTDNENSSEIIGGGEGYTK